MSEKLNKENKTKEVFSKIVNGVENLIKSDEYAKFLRFSKNFHNYSFKNLILIFSQMPNATQVAGFKKWQSMGRKLKKGAKGIQIIYPIKRSYMETNINGQTSLIYEKDSKEEKGRLVEYFTYRPTYVYDISQTVGEPLPLESKNLDSNNMIEFFEFLKDFSPYAILYKELYRYNERILEQKRETYCTSRRTIY